MGERIFRTGVALMAVGLPLGNLTLGLLVAALGLWQWPKGRSGFARLMALRPSGAPLPLRHVLRACLGGVILSGVFSPTPLESAVRGAAYVLVIWLALFVGSALAAWEGSQPHPLVNVRGFGLAAALFAAVYALVYFLLLNPGVAVRSLLLPVNESGTLWLLCIIAATAWLVHSVSPRERVTGLVGLFFALVGVTLTLSRASWLGTVLFGGLLAKRSRAARIIAAVAVAAFILAVLASPALISRLVTLVDAGFLSNVERLYVWQVAPAMVLDHWAFGIGIGRFFEVYPEYQLPQSVDALSHAHNFPLHFLVELGVFGVLPLLILLFCVTRAALGVWRETGGERDAGDGAVGDRGPGDRGGGGRLALGRIAAAGWLALLLREQFDVTNLALDVAAGFWLVGAAVLVLRYEGGPGNGSQVPEEAK